MKTKNHQPYVEEASLGATSMSVQPSYSSSFDPKADPPSPGINPILVLTISLVLSSTIAVLLGTLTWAYRRKSCDKPSNLPQIHRNPCKGCQYLHPNTSLKCAVHPGIAMTEASSDCRDYSPKQPK